MKKENEEFLKRLKDLIENCDKKGIMLDSYLIGGRKTDYCGPHLPSAESIYCFGGCTDTEVSKLHPQILITKFQLFNESIDTLMNVFLGKEDNDFTKSAFLRVTGFKIEKKDD